MGLLEYKHSDSSKRFIILTPSKIKKFGFGNKMFKGYICHEDYPLPLPQDPFLTVEQVNIIIEKALLDIKQWEAKSITAKGNFVKVVAYAIALIVIVLILYKLVVPNASIDPNVVKETVVQVVQQNVTVLS